MRLRTPFLLHHSSFARTCVSGRRKPSRRTFRCSGGKHSSENSYSGSTEPYCYAVS